MCRCDGTVSLILREMDQNYRSPEVSYQPNTLQIDTRDSHTRFTHNLWGHTITNVICTVEKKFGSTLVVIQVCSSLFNSYSSFLTKIQYSLIFEIHLFATRWPLTVTIDFCIYIRCSFEIRQDVATICFVVWCSLRVFPAWCWWFATQRRCSWYLFTHACRYKGLRSWWPSWLRRGSTDIRARLLDSAVRKHARLWSYCHLNAFAQVGIISFDRNWFSKFEVSKLIGLSRSLKFPTVIPPHVSEIQEKSPSWFEAFINVDRSLA